MTLPGFELEQEEDICLEVLQHNGGWCSVGTVQALGKLRSTAGVFKALRKLTREGKVKSMFIRGHHEYRAVFEDVR